MAAEEHRSFGGKFLDAGRDLQENLFAVFTDATMDWSGLTVFFHQVFYPYLIGGILPGMICASVAYYVAVPVRRAYQKRRRGMIKAKFEALKHKAAQKADAARHAD